MTTDLRHAETDRAEKLKNEAAEDYMLVQQALKGKEAFAKLVAKYQNRIYHIAYQILRHAADSQDITQEAFIKAYESLRRYDPGHSFLTWLARIAVNLSLNALRKRKKTPLPLNAVADPAAPEPQESQIPQVPKKKILEKLDLLRPKHRVAFILFHIEKCGYNQIASIMNVSVTSVKNYLFRARRKMRALLTPEVKLGSTGSD